jgi:membrane-associated protease RseP (regulator of RpoE activity)
MIYKKSILPPICLAALVAVPVVGGLSAYRSDSRAGGARLADIDPAALGRVGSAGSGAVRPSLKGQHYLGAKVTDVSPTDARALGLSWPARGVIVDCVIAGCPAAQSGLAINDIIVGVGGQPVFNEAQFSTLLANETAPVLSFDVLRAGRQDRVVISAHVDPALSATGVALVAPVAPNPCAVCPI